MSDRILLKVRPGAITNERKAKLLTKTYELPQDKFISAEVGKRQMLFELYLPAFQGRVHLSTGGVALKPERGAQYIPPGRVRHQFAWHKDPLEMESYRVRPLTIMLQAADGSQAQHTLQLQVMPEPLDTLTQLLLDDLTYQLHLDWQQTNDSSLQPMTEDADSPRFGSWSTLATELDSILVSMTHIGQRPFTQLRSDHQFQPFRQHQRLDPHSYRWLAQRGLQPQETQLLGYRLPVPYSQPVADCPENRFVCGVLQLAIQMLQALESIFHGEQQILEKQQFLAVARSNASSKGKFRQQAEVLVQRIADLQEKQKHRQQLLHRCYSIMQSPFFQSWHDPKMTSEVIQPPVYSLVLTQNPAYRQIFEFYTRLMASNQTDGLVRTSRLIQGVRQAGQINRATIYQTWAFVRLYRDLTLLGFEPQNGRDLNSMIEGSRLTPTLYSGDQQWLELCKSLPNSKTITLRVFHEKSYFGRPPLPEREEWAWCPDVTLQLLYQEQSLNFFLDAKFIDFEKEKDTLRNRLFKQPTRAESLSGVQKYLDIPCAYGSFILHPSTHPDFENYGATLPANGEVFSPDQPGEPAQFRLGYLPFRPQQTTAFRKWLGLIIVRHLQQHQYCWNCHQTNVSRQSKQYCPDCRTSWQLIRCRRCNRGLVFLGEEAPFNWSPGTDRPLCPDCGKET